MSRKILAVFRFPIRVVLAVLLAAAGVAGGLGSYYVWFRAHPESEARVAPLQRDGGAVDTVGGLVTAIFGRVPRAQESIEHRGFILEVVDAERKRVNRVRFRRLPPEA